MEQAQPLRWEYGAALLGLLAEGSLGILDLEVPELGHRPGQAQGGRKDFPATFCLQTQGKHGLTRWPLLLPCGPKSWGGDQAATCLLPELVQLTQPCRHRERMDPGASC